MGLATDGQDLFVMDAAACVLGVTLLYGRQSGLKNWRHPAVECQLNCIHSRGWFYYSQQQQCSRTPILTEVAVARVHLVNFVRADLVGVRW